MYERFFSLDASPFVLTPDPRFLFRSRGHHDILTSLLYGIASQKGIMALIGDVGAGQSELADRLRRRELRQLDQRIGIRCQLQPLSRNETFRYIEHRLRAAGLAGSMPFTRAALARIYSRSRGTPRVVNLVCDRALLAAYSTGARVIDDRLVRLAIRNLWGRNPVTLRARAWRRPVAVAAAAVGITVGVGAGTVHWRYARNPASHASLGVPAEPAD